MQAVIFPHTGGPDVLEMVDRPDPRIQRPDQVLLRLLAAGVNPIDTKIRARGLLTPAYDHNIPGCDGVGIVEACGAEVGMVAPGQRVAFCHGGVGPDPGTYATAAVVPEAALVPVPARVSDAEAAALPLAWITAWEALLDRARLRPGQTLLVHAANGGVGQMAVQLGRQAGARVLGAVRGDAAAELVRELGVAVLDRRAEDFGQQWLDFSGGLGFDVVLDTVGAEIFEESLNQIVYGGDVVTLLSPPATTDWASARPRNPRISLELMLTPMLNGDRGLLRAQAGMLRTGLERLARGELRVNVEAELPLAQAAEAHRLLESGVRKGKIVLRI
jgi:NADPH:quinone reductase